MSQEQSSSRGTKRRYDGKKVSQCKYGKNCYRQNVEHFIELSHPDDAINKSSEECSKLFRKREIVSKTADQKTSSCCSESIDSNQYSLYYNKVEGVDRCFNETCLSIKDILSDKFGNLIKSVQFNYLIDIPWLMNQYSTKHKSKPLLIVHGFKDREKMSLHEEANRFDNIRLCQADLTIPYGTHHTKMMIHLYEEGLRVIVTTANLVESDWTMKTQSIWMSPMFQKHLPGFNEHCNKLTDTNFQGDLTNYLAAYKKHQLNEWIQIINEHDLSSAKVHLVASVPGRFATSGDVNYGHLKLKRILQEKLNSLNNDSSFCSIVCQTSSIGSLGEKPESWLTGEFLTSLSSHLGGSLQKSLKIVYPTVENISNSLEGYMAGSSFPYSKKVAARQPYLRDFMQQWKFDARGRSCAMPHLKSYFHLSSDNDVVWYLLTSSNVSKAAWGCFEKKQTQLFIRSYELGILFLPQYFDNPSKNVLVDFPISLDIPLTPYSPNDVPWVYDVNYTERTDSHGRIWKIS